jgi:hypothetical protein
MRGPVASPCSVMVAPSPPSPCPAPYPPLIVYLGMRWALKRHLGDGLRAACSVMGEGPAVEQAHHLLPHHDPDEHQHLSGGGRGSNGNGSKAFNEMVPLVSRH